MQTRHSGLPIESNLYQAPEYGIIHLLFLSFYDLPNWSYTYTKFINSINMLDCGGIQLSKSTAGDVWSLVLIPYFNLPA